MFYYKFDIDFFGRYHFHIVQRNIIYESVISRLSRSKIDKFPFIFV